ncbi:hypothetical protein [Campylobacter phage CJLB-14]|nr:hypothetical protein [Campylobacter phage CJLB-14]
MSELLVNLEIITSLLKACSYKYSLKVLSF